MGAQTSHSLISARALVSSQSGDALELARGLFAAAMGLSGSPALRSQLTDSSRDLAPRHALANQAFASLSTDVKKLVDDAVALRWSRAEDLQAGLEEMAIRLCGDATSGSIDLVGELLAVSDLVHSDGDVELALGSKQATASARAQLMGALLRSKVSPAAQAICEHLVADPRGRRIGAMLAHSATMVAEQQGMGLAMVRVAQPLGDAQIKHIETLLQGTYQRPHYIAVQIDPEVVGGLRIRVGDNEIDGSIATRLQDLRTQLAG